MREAEAAAMRGAKAEAAARIARAMCRRPSPAHRFRVNAATLHKVLSGVYTPRDEEEGNAKGHSLGEVQRRAEAQPG
jgi:hypothetical protein